MVLRASVDLGCPAFPVHVAADSIWDVAVAGMRVHVRTPAYALRDSPSPYALEQIASHSGREVVSHRLPLSDSRHTVTLPRRKPAPRHKMLGIDPPNPRGFRPSVLRTSLETKIPRYCGGDERAEGGVTRAQERLRCPWWRCKRRGRPQRKRKRTTDVRADSVASAEACPL